jgi:hypothetical protein
MKAVLMLYQRRYKERLKLLMPIRTVKVVPKNKNLPLIRKHMIL